MGNDRLSARDVHYEEAIRWFESRRATYERLIGAARRHIDPHGVIIDVGANIGYFTKLLRELGPFDGDAYLFEPVPHLAELCATTFADSPKTKVHPFGLSDSDAELSIYLAGDGNLGWNTIVAEKANSGMTPVPIQVRAFDTCGIHVTPSFIKIDVEGAEYRVLRGMLVSLAQWSPRPVILCEVGWGQNHPAWAEELTVFAQLTKLGYQICNLDEKPIDVAGIRATTDVLFLPVTT